MTRLALRRPVSAVLILLAIAVFGVLSIFSFKLELQPDMELPMMVVVTVYPGADPASVEALVVKPIESAGSVLSGVKKTTSTCMDNVGYTMFSYEYGMNMDDAYIDMRAALDTASADLPADAQRPYIMELNMDAQDTVTISATAIGDIDLLSYVNNDVVKELETLMGVADVSVSGGRENYYKVEMIPEKMAQYGLTMSQIAQFMAAIDFTYPAGTVSAGNQDMNISTSALAKTVMDLTKIPVVTATGSVITLGEVANITQADRQASSISRYDGFENITIGVSKKQSQGTVNVAAAVKKAVAVLNASNEAVDLKIVYDAS